MVQVVVEGMGDGGELRRGGAGADGGKVVLWRWLMGD